MEAIETFRQWWNQLAQRNGKLKFSTQREAADFVRRVHNQNGGPNEALVAMRKQYNEVNRAKKHPSNSGSYTCQGTSVL